MRGSALALTMLALALACSKGYSGPRNGRGDRPPLFDDFSHEWTMRLDGSSHSLGTSVALTRSGTANRSARASTRGIAIGGSFEGSVQVGPERLKATGGLDGFLAHLDGHGRVTWAHSFGSAQGSEWISAVTADSRGHAIAALATAASLRVGDSTVDIDGDPGALLIRFDTDGRATWTRPVHASQRLQIVALATGPDDSIVCAGMFHGTMRIAQRVLTSAGGSDFFVFKLDPNGALAWAMRGGGRYADAALSVSFVGQRIALGGSFSNRADIGKHTLTAYGAGKKRRPAQDAFTLALDARGTLLWGRSFGRQAPETAFSVALSPTGMTYVVGAFSGDTQIGENALSSRGKSDGFIAVYDREGLVPWAISIGGEGRDHALAAAAIDDSVLVTGTFEGAITAGTHRIRSAGSHDIFIARVTSRGRVTWADRFGGGDADAVTGLIASPEGGFTLVGSISGDADPPGPNTGFAARFRP